VDERGRIELLERLFRPLAGPDVAVGVGDDAAVLELGPEPVVCSVDAAVEGTHFERRWLGLDDLGFKATMAALSDLAAMGARARAVLAALGLPDDVDDTALEAIARGQAEACRLAGAALVGGNLARSRELSITTTVIGQCARPLTRAGARPGDGVWLAGDLGLAAAGLGLARRAHGDEGGACRRALERWRRPRALLDEGRAAAALAHAAIDVSDGLLLDVHRLATASAVSIVLEQDGLVSNDLTELAALLEMEALDLALGGGEDYALIVTLPAGSALEGFVHIGSVEAAPPSGSGPKGPAPPSGSGPKGPERASRLWLATPAGRQAVEPRGFDHFAR
jgi:thiamine-monophosphate kinase